VNLNRNGPNMSERNPSSAPTTHSGKPPRGPSLRIIVICAVIALIAMTVGVAIGPVVKSWADSHRAAAVEEKAASGTWYISQMHPWIIQPEPGQCPICGMDLTPVDPDRFAGEISIDPVIVQNMGVRIAEARIGDIIRDVRTVGTVTIDESQVTDIVQRFGGWIEEMYVDAKWTRVAAGDPLFRIYAPQVLTAEREWLIASQAIESAHKEQLLDAAEQRLKLMALPPEELSRLQSDGTATDTVTIRSPVSGVVWTKNINQGSQIMPNTVAYRLVALGSVWVEATIYEQQLPFISLGQTAQVRMDYGARREFSGRIERIYPAVDQQTREVRVRFVFENADGPQGPVLKPGMFATVFMPSLRAAQAVTVPAESVIGTGSRNVVFVSLGRGKFEPRDVTLGPKGSDGRIAIQDGITAGEQVVTSGQFLLDSESKMREALAKIMKGDLATEQAPAPAPQAGSLIELPGGAQEAWAKVVRSYLALQEVLYDGDGSMTGEAVASLHASVAEFVDIGTQADQHFHHKYPDVASLQSQAVALNIHAMPALRVGFGDLSITMNGLLKVFGQPSGLASAVVGMRCGMAEGVPRGGVWLQRGDDVRNPYYGASSEMRSCAAEVWALPKAGQADTERERQAPSDEADDGTAKQSTGALISIEPEHVEMVLALQRALYANDLEQSRTAGKELKTALEDLGVNWVAAMHQAHAISLASDLQSARVAFGHVLVAVRDAAAAGSGAFDGVNFYRCGMARDVPEKGVWLQGEAGPIRNPYFGAGHGMAGCAMESWKATAEGLIEVEVK
jgi:Cu(I)/Ag(I) efflux system membrane fusion protein